MIRILLICFGAFSWLFAVAIAQPPVQIAGSPQEKKATDAVKEAKDETTESYRLSAHDSVRVTVFGEEDFSTTARIGKDLVIAMPRIGLVKIGGQTVREAAETIEGKLREYLIKPQVAVAVLDYTKRRITILGQVTRPGTFDLPDEASIDLLEAIGMAGGYSRIANPSKITLKRSVNGQETIFKLDGKSMLNKEAAERFRVLPGDTILVGERIF